MNGPIIAYRGNIGVQTTAPFANTYSLDFDGVDDYVDCGDSDDFSFGNGTNDLAFSISAWVKMDDATNFGIISKSDNTNGNSEYLFYTDASNRITLLLYTALSINRYRGRRYSVALTEGVWMHLAATYDGQGGVNAQDGIKIYLNGTRVDNTNISNGAYVAMPNGNAPLEIGVKGTQRSNGNIDEVAIFNSELSAPAINDIYNLGTPTDLSLLSTPPIAWYRNGDNGAYKSPQWLIPSNENKDNVSNYSLDFDGVDDYISVSDNSIGKTQNISYSIWVNLDVTTRQYIIGNQSSSNGGCGLQIESGDVLVFQMGDGGNDSFFNSRVVNFSTYAPINTWNHILATWDGTDSKIYINGVLRNTWSPTLPYTISSYDTTFNIGWRNAGFQYMTNGKLDELALFDSAISIGDVWDGSGQPIDVSTVSGITNNWRMGEEATFSGGVWTVPDNVGSNDGTSNAMTIDDRVGEAPNSENNALSFNMDLVDRTTDVPT